MLKMKIVELMMIYSLLMIMLEKMKLMVTVIVMIYQKSTMMLLIIYNAFNFTNSLYFLFILYFFVFKICILHIHLIFSNILFVGIFLTFLYVCNWLNLLILFCLIEKNNGICVILLIHIIMFIV